MKFIVPQIDLNNLIQLGESENEGLEHICFAPLSTANMPAKRSQCLIQNIWGIWQDDFDNFNSTSEDEDHGVTYTVNYLDYILRCTQ